MNPTQVVLGLALACIACTTTTTSAFQSTPLVTAFHRATAASTTTLHETEPDAAAAAVDEVIPFLQKYYPTFYEVLVSRNKDITDALKAPSAGYTFFAASDSVFEDKLGEKKVVQLRDDRNFETTEKVSGYHFIATEALTDAQLRTEDWTVPKSTDGSPRPLTIGGVVTLSGELRVGRSKSGGFFGFGGKEDGGIVVGPDAKIIQSKLVGNCMIHEVDNLVSPELLWRYFDQLRIPGSK